jgi:quercetin dioxygenase-like cupin family protein
MTSPCHSPALPSRLRHALLATFATLVVGGERAWAEPPVVHFEDVVRAHPVDPAKGAVVTEILRGEQASVNVWQITDTMAAHLHREHEEIIIVRSGRARARIGDRDVDLGPGDVFLVPRNTVHAARAIGEEPFVGVSVFAPAFDGKDRVAVPAPAPTP